MNFLRYMSALTAVLLSSSAWADITVQDAWVRATIPAQRATGAFMNIQTTEAVSLIGARSNLSKVTEVHEMRMENNVMKMQAIARIDISPDKPLNLKPGSYHIMLMELNKPATAGERVDLTLIFEKTDKSRFEKNISADIKPLTMKAHGTHAH